MSDRSGGSAVADLSEYMTVDEFAALPSDAHHAVWRAHADKRVDSVPASASTPNGTRRYHRAQVKAVLYLTATGPRVLKLTASARCLRCPWTVSGDPAVTDKAADKHVAVGHPTAVVAVPA